jgi:hypothetical protein
MFLTTPFSFHLSYICHVVSQLPVVADTRGGRPPPPPPPYNFVKPCESLVPNITINVYNDQVSP